MMAHSPDEPNIWRKIGSKVPEPVISVFQKHLRPYLPDVSFVTLHWLYFLSTCMLASIIFWGSSTPFRSVSYTDSLFLAVSAMTEAGLNTVNLSTLNTWQQVILFILIMMGSSIFVSTAILHVRKRAFERTLEDVLKKRRAMGLAKPFNFRRRNSSSAGARKDVITSGVLRDRTTRNDHEQSDSNAGIELKESHSNGTSDGRSGDRSRQEEDSGHIKFDANVQPPRENTRESIDPASSLRRANSRLFIGSGVGVRSLENHPRNARPPGDQNRGNFEETEQEGAESLIDKYRKQVDGYVGRNSQFHNLSEKERRELGGIEYDAVSLLYWVVPTYFVLWQLIGAVGVGAWLQINRPSTTLTNGLNPFWTGAFFAVSAFNNSGMALLDANAVALQNTYYPLLTLSILILAGNTCFPPFLRLILWTMKKTIPKSPKWERRRQILEFILDHPRRVYTNLFPSAQTWWLVFSLFLLNGIDWVAFEVLNIGNPVTQAIAPRFRVLDGLFQAFAVRSGGFYIVSISSLRSGLLVLYVLMMYVSALPVTMTIRNTNVYEERSLGIFSEDEAEKLDGTDKIKRRNSLQSPGMLGSLKRVLTAQHGISPRPHQNTAWSRQDFIRQQLRGQLGHDVWWLALAVLLITIVETGQFERNPVVFSTFNVIFEVVSAYGTVGISTGVPWDAYSFCGAWHTLSKLILCAVMLRGRHRGLPVAIDKAVLLPDETLAWAEEEDAEKRSHNHRQNSRSATGIESGDWSGRGGEPPRKRLTGDRAENGDAAHLV